MSPTTKQKKQTICCIWHLNTFSICGCGVSVMARHAGTDAHREKWMRHGNVCLKKEEEEEEARRV